jgi:3'-5' exoribonuclease
MKTLFISDIKDGMNLTDQFMIKGCSKAETKAKKTYLNVVLMDQTGDISCKVWDQAERFLPLCEEGKVVEVQAKCQSYRSNLQLSITAIQPLDQALVDMGKFVPTTEYDVEEMATEFIMLAKSIKDPFIRKLLLKFFNNDEFFAIFKKAPAAKAMHHAYLGGLLEHTLGVARLADKVAGLYPGIDRSLLLAGAMLHDIGKVKEFSFDTHVVDYSDTGRLMGHMVIGVEMVQEQIRKIKDFPEELGVRIKHLILSHHGRYEFGSPTLPMLMEGFVLNFVDDMDAKLNTITGVSKKATSDGYQWSDYQRSLERFLFVKGHDPEETSESPASSAGRTQPSLF